MLYFDFPGKLQKLWPRALQVAGFEVGVDAEQQYVDLRNENMCFCGGEARWNGLTAGIVGEPGNGIVRFLLGVSSDRDERFLDAVTRVLFAAGAKMTHFSKQVHCKRLYIASDASTEVCLATLGEYMSATAGLGTLHQKMNGEFPPDYIGTVRKHRMSIDVFVGRSLNVCTDHETNYIALDYHRPHLMAGKYLKHLEGEVNEIIMGSDAYAVSFC